MGLQNVSKVYAVVFVKICQVIIACRGVGQTIFDGNFSEQMRSIVKSYLKAKNVSRNSRERENFKKKTQKYLKTYKFG